MYHLTSDTPECSITVVAVDKLSGKRGTYALDLIHGKAEANRVTIQEDLVQRGVANQLTAQLLDQFGQPMSDIIF